MADELFGIPVELQEATPEPTPAPEPVAEEAPAEEATEAAAPEAELPPPPAEEAEAEAPEAPASPAAAAPAAAPATPAPPPVSAKDQARDQALTDMARMMQVNPKFRQAYFEQLNAEGRLPPEYQAELQQGAEAPAKPQVTEEQVMQAIDQLVTEGKTKDAMVLQQRWNNQKLRDIEQAGLAREQQREQQEQARTRQAQMSQAQQRRHTEMATVAEKYPDLVVAQPGSAVPFRFKDKAFYQAFAEMAPKLEGVMSLGEVAEVVLAKQGRIAKPRKGENLPAPAKPGRSSPPIGAAKPARRSQEITQDKEGGLEIPILIMGEPS